MADMRPASLAAAFACAVTISDEGSLMARNGRLSLFSAYETIFPEVSIWKHTYRRTCSDCLHFLRSVTKDQEDTL